MRKKTAEHPDLIDLDRLISPGRVCQVLDVTYECLADWGRKGYIKWVVLPGGRKRYPLSEVQRIVKGEWHNLDIDTPPTGERA